MDKIRIICHREGDAWWAESPDVDGWYAAADTYAELARLTDDGIPFALDRKAELEYFVPAGEQTSL